MRSATVLGPELPWADVFATAVAACGPLGLDWLAAEEGYEALLVDERGSVVATAGWPQLR